MHLTKKEDISRFHSKYEPVTESGCWLWTGGCSNPEGYGTFKANGIAKRAHRLSYELHKGEIPEGLLVLHMCDIPACVNPDHLFLGTDKDNSDDKIAKGRQIKGEGCHSAKLTNIDVLSIRDSIAKGVSRKTLATLYKVGLTCIAEIHTRHTWKHI